jgi:hypothetical protein
VALALKAVDALRLFSESLLVGDPARLGEATKEWLELGAFLDRKPLEVVPRSKRLLGHRAPDEPSSRTISQHFYPRSFIYH